MLAIVASMAVTIAAAPAAAQSESAADRAYALFQESVEKYRQGRFEEAAELLEEAYELDPDPVLVYNLARAYEGMGAFARAVDAYERFLEQDPDTPDRGAIEARLETLRREAAERDRREARREDDGGGSSLAVPLCLMGMGAAALGVGALFGVLSEEAHDDAVAAPDFTSAYTAQEDAESFALAANVAFVLGGVVLAAGTGWLLLGLSGEEAEETRVGAAVGPGTAALTLHHRW